MTGYDDLEEASISTPSLTTVSNGQAEVGRLAARALLDRLAGSHEPDGIHLIKPEMRIRQSTGRAFRVSNPRQYQSRLFAGFGFVSHRLALPSASRSGPAASTFFAFPGLESDWLSSLEMRLQEE